MHEQLELISPKVIARWFVNHADRDAGDVVTQLKLQKLVYYAEAWFLANFDRALIAEDFEAWAHGPALRSLYAKYRDYGWEALPPESGRRPPESIADFLKAVYEEYGQYSAKKLERMTHQEAPWLDAREGLLPEAASQRVIPKLSIRNFYAARIGKEKIQKLQN
ncbi:MAG: type II toxin-antitoxin system antitoxin SocA domain-containing protein [Pseudomonadota bacterium]